MATLAISDSERPRLLDSWTKRGLTTAIAPLLPWGAASVFLLAVALGVPWWVAWIPALSTTGVMLGASLLSMRPGLDRHIRNYARNLAAFAIVLDALVSGVQHITPAHVADPSKALVFLVCILPPVMGGLLYHAFLLARAQERDMVTAWEAAKRQAEADRIAREQAASAALAAEIERARVSEAERGKQLAHERQLAEIAAQTARDAEREATARRTVETALKPPVKTTRVKPHLVPDPPADGPVDALGRKARPAPKRDAALRYLLDAHRSGRNLDDITAAEVDKAIKANGYSKSRLPTWITDVRAYDKGAA